MKKILLLAYQISPTKGSEYSVGWNFLINLAKNNKIYLLYGASGKHMGDVDEIIQYFNNNPNINISIYPVKPNLFSKIFNYPNRLGLLNLSFIIAFRFWQKTAYRVAKKIIKLNEIDIVHHLNPIGFREPGYLWKINKPFVWGPIGASMIVDIDLLSNSNLKDKIYFLLKNLITIMQLKYSSRVRKASNKASFLIFCNSQSKNIFQKYVGFSGEVIPEQGTFQVLKTGNISIISSINRLNIVWAGNFSPRKNLQFLFYSLSLLPDKERWVLNIVGDGSDRKFLEQLAFKLSINSNIIWHGLQSRDNVFNIISKCDLMALTSLSEGNPAIMFESISYGVPIISLDRDGMHDILSGGNGILVPVTTYDETAYIYASSIQSFIDFPSKLENLKLKTTLLSPTLSWPNIISKFDLIYDSAISSFKAYHR